MWVWSLKFMELSENSGTRVRYLWLTSIGASLVGLVDSIYLTWIKLADQTAACSRIGDCESVNNSQYSEIAGIPIALLGAGAFLTILLLLVLENRLADQSANLRLAVFGLSLAGSLYSGYLTYLEIAVLRAICPFCVVSAISIFMLLILGIFRLRESFAEID
jgi:uncharacterized membrane protein